ncbi:Uncharacterized protein BP5553_00195 [Venustampulla echinocandica]|uniref:Succinate dehydrogenase assembly factor 4, mitochondrial n=1 Tax=Venustampulla echinocandica TaxID=2656787 RepID=A0A370TXF2_9HELO|nr:Uncharacterized protein BP5553_00195 [Venustampulla echinocandica]RDL40216.1 Uncharacterized protein BP5553_00195 [Venustampulla echinocandica]
MVRYLPSTFCLPSRRLFTQTARRTAFATGPAPPRLPPKEQEEFERLQKSSTGAFSTAKPAAESTSSPAPSGSRPQVNQSPASKPESDEAQINARVEASGKGDELHPDIRRGAKPEFEGDVNPKTGEVGGPKNDPLRWGAKADWSYNGRVTDF